jgi:hypothetical protein
VRADRAAECGMWSLCVSGVWTTLAAGCRELRGYC